MTQKIYIAIAVISFITSTLFAEDQPPNAIPGKCYAKSYVSDKYETVTEQVSKKVYKLEDVPATFKEIEEKVLVKKSEVLKKNIPAIYDTIIEQVLVKEAYTITEIIPAVYDMIEEQVLVKEGYTGKKTVPATYETIIEEVEITPASTKWTSKKSNNCFSTNPEDCIIWYLEEIPAKTKSISKQVLKTPETIRDIEVPAEYKSEKRKVLVTPEIKKEFFVPAEYTDVKKVILQTPATTIETIIPEEYTTIKKKILDEPAKIIEIALPDEYEKVVKTILSKKGDYYVWREVLCESERGRDSILKIQKALKEKGYDPFSTDGVYGNQTRIALIAFQKSNGLPEGHLDYETLELLGIK